MLVQPLLKTTSDYASFRYIAYFCIEMVYEWDRKYNGDDLYSIEGKPDDSSRTGCRIIIPAALDGARQRGISVYVCCCREQVSKDLMLIQKAREYVETT